MSKHLPTQDAVIKTLVKILGDDSVVRKGHLISSAPGFYVANGLRNVVGPTIFVVSTDREKVTDMLADVLEGNGVEIARNPKRPSEVTVNFIPRGARA